MLDAVGAKSDAGSTRHGAASLEAAHSGAPSAALPHAPPSSLTHRTARGFIWVSLEALSSKAVNMLAQMALARLLAPEDWGLVGLAFTVSVFADLLAGAGFREVLVQRWKRFHLWATPATWMSLVFGLLAALVMVSLAPVAAAFYHSPGLSPLIYVLALSSPLLSIASVPEARLRGQMRFRSIGVLSGVRNLGTTLGTVICAALGLGAMSFVVPRPVFALAYAIGAWWLARPPVGMRLHWRRWRFLVGDSFTVLLASVVLMSISLSGSVALGRLCSEDVVGYYYFAYNLSLQTAVLLGLNLASVLFPALAALQHDPVRQLAAFIRASRMLAAVGIPFCALQAALATPFITLFFGERMLPAIWVFAILSLGMGYHVMWNPSRSLLQSGGRFGLSLITLTTYAAIFIPAVIIGAKFGEAIGVAIAMATLYTVFAPIETYIAVRTIGGGWREVSAIYFMPTVLTILAIGPWVIAAEALPDATWAMWLQLVATPLLSGMIYVLLLRWRLPTVLAEMRQRLMGVRMMFRRVAVAAVP